MRPFTFGEYLGARLGLLPLPLFDSFHAVLFGRTLAVSVELGVFDALEARPHTAASLAAEFRIPKESAALLLGALEAGGYLRLSGDTYALNRLSRRWLASSSPEYLGHFIRYVALLHRKWLDLEVSLRQGRPRSNYTESFSGEEWRTYVLGMRDLARLLIPSLTRTVAIPAGAKKLLDVGGSHGSYTAALCKRHPQLHGTIVDLPQALAVTRELLAAGPATLDIELHGVDITRDSLPGSGYDVALLFNMIHGFAADVNARIVRSVSNVLAPGGTLYILDQFRDSRARGTRRLLPYLVGLNLLNEAGGTAFDRHEVDIWCRGAGLRLDRTIRAGLPGVKVIIATKTGP